MTSNTPVLLDPTGLSKELKELQVVTNRTIVNLDQLLTEFETLGETEVSVAGHSINRENGVHKVEQTNHIVFKAESKARHCFVACARAV